MVYDKKSPSVGNSSVYSHVTARSSANLRGSRSIKSLKTPWYQKPLLQSTFILDIQRAAMVTAAYSIVSTNRFVFIYFFLRRRLNFVIVSSDFHSVYGCVWCVLPRNGYAWIHSLRLLRYFVRVCLRRKSARYFKDGFCFVTFVIVLNFQCVTLL